MTEQERLSLLDTLYRSYEALTENDERLKTVTDGVPYGDKGKKGHYLLRAKTNIFLIGVLEHKNPLWLAVPKKKEKSLYPVNGRGELKLNRNSMQHAFKGLGTEKLEPGNDAEDDDENNDADDAKCTRKKKKEKKKRKSKEQRKKMVKPVRVQKFRPMQVDHMLGKAFPGLLCEFARLMNDVGLYEEVIQDLILPPQGAPSTEPQPSTNLKLLASSSEEKQEPATLM